MNPENTVLVDVASVNMELTSMRRVFDQSVIFNLLELPLARSEHAMNIFYIEAMV